MTNPLSHGRYGRELYFQINLHIFEARTHAVYCLSMIGIHYQYASGEIIFLEWNDKKTCFPERFDVVLQRDRCQRVDRRRDGAQRRRKYSGNKESRQA